MEAESQRSQLAARIRTWAHGNDNVRALVQTGSLARRDGLVDAFSDLDMDIIAQDPVGMAKNDDWIHRFGEVITILHLDAVDAQSWPTRLVIYAGGIKVDFTLAGLARLQKMASPAGLDPLYERGYQLLVDKDAFAKALPAATYRFPVHAMPDEQRFLARVEEFWFEAFHVPRYLARDELLLAKQRDGTMKELLLEMIEWHAIARHPEPVDIWHLGKGIRHWAGEAIWAELQATYGHFDASDARRAYQATTALYARLAREVARIQGWPYPESVERALR
ncbi:aminoglycoside 6-adenylyltransferase [Klebsiella sp. I138]|uniref:aminoglycoside 6-adenylyltransferase n=1 Tax=Klebsiella sp. I138 TaxID=2755385 RepID=UPI003DA84023